MSNPPPQARFSHSQFFSLDPISQVEKEIFLDKVWPILSSQQGSMNKVDDFDFYFKCISQERKPAAAKDHAITTFDDLFFIIGIVQSHGSSVFGQLITKIQNSRPNLATVPSRLSNSIELAVRVWLMMNIRNRVPPDLYQHQTSIPWHDNYVLPWVLAQNFKRHQCDQHSKFSEYFNAQDMKRIGGIKVEWTNNLALHLTIKDSLVYIFHGVSILKRMQESASTSPFLEREFFEETLATIDLLIPFTKASCDGWLADEIKLLGLDKNIRYRDAPVMEKSRYPYWQKKLLAVEDAFEKSKPRTFLQWWHDTRDMQQWWGFWLVVTGIFLTVLFGLIQSVTGIIQVSRPNRSSS